MAEFFSTLLDVLLDSLKDLALILPVLYLTYFLMELIEHLAGDRTLNFIKRSRGWGPLAGGLLGAIPECGIAGGIAGLYSGGVITAGAFVAAMLSTSDEMIPVMISEGQVLKLLSFVGYKAAFGIAAGFAVDLVSGFVKRSRWYEVKSDFGTPLRRKDICNICETDSCDCGHEHASDDPDGGGCGHRLWLAALIHTLKICGIIFAVSLVIGMVMELTDAEAFFDAAGGIPVVGELAASAFGLIPNCSVSVTLTGLYLKGVIGAGPMMAGLLKNGGVGLLVLWRVRRGKRFVLSNLAICGILWILGVAGGLLASLIF